MSNTCISYFLLILTFAGCYGNPDAKRLYDDLLSNYNKLVRPVVNVSDALTVKIKLKLSQLIDVIPFKFVIGISTGIFFLVYMIWASLGLREKGIDESPDSRPFDISPKTSGGPKAITNKLLLYK